MRMIRIEYVHTMVKKVSQISKKKSLLSMFVHNHQNTIVEEAYLQARRN